MKQLCDLVIAREFASPDLEFAWRDDAPSNPAKVASVAVDYVKAGIKSVNEVRAELGLDPIGVAPDVRSQPQKPAAASKQTLLRFNPNHYGRGPQGGQFAPAGAGSDDGDASSAGTPPHAQTAQEILFGRVPLLLDEPPVRIPQPLPDYPSDPTKPPAPGFEWKGTNPTPGPQGSWYNEQTKHCVPTWNIRRG